jgi:alkaline phosphatase D
MAHTPKSEPRGLSRRKALQGALLTGAAACAPTRATAFEGEAKFLHGVASGDPGDAAVVIWTRVSVSGAGPAPVRWIVARDPKLRRVVQDGEFMTDASRDYTVKVDVGGLEPGKRYYYGFVCGRTKSPVGKTRTLPAKGVDKLVFAVCSCSHYGFGFFNGYREIAKRNDLDAVLHLGDYIYEYGPKAYGGEVGVKLGRAPVPPSEIVSLSDYRARHAQYKTDPDLQAAHAAAPWIVTWDDHETTNDSWRHGAENHQPETEGDWDDRKRAALQAYFEWMPIREPHAGRPWEAIDRSFQFGDLATLLMLETRLLARDQQLDYSKDLTPREMAWNMDARPPRPVAAGETPANQQVLPMLVDTTGPAPQVIESWARASKLDPKALPAGVATVPDLQRFQTKLNDPKRTLFGPDQAAWIKGALAASAAAKTPWQVFGNQVLMARINAPDLSAMPEAVIAQLEKLSPRLRQFVQLTKLGLPLNLDAWDGYPAERERLLKMIADAGANAIVVTGDTHTAWANAVTSADGAQRLAVEFGGTSITSPGLGNLVKLPGASIGDMLRAKNPNIAWTDQENRGYLILTFTRSEAMAEFHTISAVVSRTYQDTVAARFKVKPVAGPGIGAIETA